MAALVDFSWKLGLLHCPKKISSASMLDVGRYLPLFSMARAAVASSPVTEKVLWKPSWGVELDGTVS